MNRFKILLVLIVLIPPVVLYTLCIFFGWSILCGLLLIITICIPLFIAALRVGRKAGAKDLLELNASREEVCLGRNPVEVICIEKPSSEIFEHLAGVVQRFPGRNHVETNMEVNTIRISTSPSIYSLGEKVFILVSATEESKSRVIISSKPKFPKLDISSADWVKNVRNIREIVSFLEEFDLMIEDSNSNQVQVLLDEYEK